MSDFTWSDVDVEGRPDFTSEPYQYVLIHTIEDEYLSGLMFNSVLSQRDVMVSCFCGELISLWSNRLTAKCKCGARATKVVSVSADTIEVMLTAEVSGLQMVHLHPGIKTVNNDV